MPTRQKKNDEFFESIAPKVQSTPVMITTHNQVKKSALGRWGLFYLFLFIVAAGLAVYFFIQNGSAQNELLNLKAQNEKTRQDLLNMPPLEKIGRHLVLPEGEQPAIATILDAEGLKKVQPLYSEVKDGDQLVTFKAMQIVYDPILDKIVYVRALVSGNIPADQSGQVNFTNPSAQVQPITLDIRNGAALPGLAGKTASALGKEATYKVIKVGNAQKQIYTKTVIVNLKNRDVSNLEARFGVKAVTQLPIGEPASTADVVVIVGK